jgi:hypothetical protein
MSENHSEDVSLFKRPDWMRFMGYARMHVSVSGGPIHNPHTEVLQLLTDFWFDGLESWTVYRHEREITGDGKVVHKAWEIEKDKARFRALGNKEAPKEWLDETNITEATIQVDAKWVSDLEHRIDAIRIPPICGEAGPLTLGPRFQLRLWRADQKAELAWKREPPEGWKALSELFIDLQRELRELRPAQD